MNTGIKVLLAAMLPFAVNACGPAPEEPHKKTKEDKDTDQFSPTSDIQTISN